MKYFIPHSGSHEDLHLRFLPYIGAAQSARMLPTLLYRARQEPSYSRFEGEGGRGEEEEEEEEEDDDDAAIVSIIGNRGRNQSSSRFLRKRKRQGLATLV